MQMKKQTLQCEGLTIIFLHNDQEEPATINSAVLRREESLRERQGQNARQALIDSAFDDLEDACTSAWSLKRWYDMLG